MLLRTVIDTLARVFHALPRAVKKQTHIKRFQSMINKDLARTHEVPGGSRVVDCGYSGRESRTYIIDSVLLGRTHRTVRKVSDRDVDSAALDCLKVDFRRLFVSDLQM